MASEYRFGSRRSLPEGRARFVLMFTIPALALGACVGLAVTGNLPGVGGGSAKLTAANPAFGGGASPDLALTSPQDPQGNQISLNQTAAQAATSMNCTITVPASPLTAAGLETPFQLGDGCTMTNADEQAYVEATILAPAGQVTVYNPLVITAGTRPAVAPAPVTIPTGSQVVIDFGFNGSNLVLQGSGAQQGNCIDAYGQSIIAQTPACNAAAFYQAANAQIASGALKVPALGTGSDGQPCQTTESFATIDQDQSDNVVSAYLLNGAGQTAQDTAANARLAGETPINNNWTRRTRTSSTNFSTLRGATTVTNGSDDGLLDAFLDPALGCKPWTVTDATSSAGASSSQALNALMAQQDQKAPVALLPVNDPQLLVNGNFSIGKTNAYRAETDEPALSSTTSTAMNAAKYCQNMVNIQSVKLAADEAVMSAFASPVPTLGSNLYTTMAARLDASVVNLSCKDYGIRSPVTLTLDGNGVATAATLDTTQQQYTLPGTGGGPTPSPTTSQTMSPAPSASPTRRRSFPPPSPSTSRSFRGF
jgi:hypothetical protein